MWKWFGGVFLHRAQGNLITVKYQWILHHCEILNKNLLSPTRTLKMGHGVMDGSSSMALTQNIQQRHKKNHGKVLEWPCPGLNSTDSLWRELKLWYYKCPPRNLKDLKYLRNVCQNLSWAVCKPGDQLWQNAKNQLGKKVGSTNCFAQGSNAYFTH